MHTWQWVSSILIVAPCGLILLVMLLVALPANSTPVSKETQTAAGIDMTAASPVTQSDAATDVSSVVATVVAEVNGYPLHATELEVLVTADRAMAALLQTAQAPHAPWDQDASAQDTLERLINLELVRQEARRAGFAVTASDTQNALRQFLASQGQTRESLRQVLASVALPLSDFTEYFGLLLLVDQFSQQLTIDHGSVDAYMCKLQETVRISYGLVPETAFTETTFAATTAETFTRVATLTPPVLPPHITSTRALSTISSQQGSVAITETNDRTETDAPLVVRRATVGEIESYLNRLRP